jgi:putative ABC transport system permease protein
VRVRLKQQRLRELLAASRLSQNHWALKIGISRGHWSGIVNGKHPYPSPRTRARMLETFACPLEDLFEIEAGIEPWADTDFRRAISDRYLIDSELGTGGMGAVYLGRDVRHGRTIAVKVISPEAVSGIGVDQFLREIATVAKLQHPNILPLFDSGEAAGHPFYVMPYIREGSLRARLERLSRLPASEAIGVACDVAAALEHAHRHRILHCDVKPENILLDGSHAYVMDFGIARKLHTEVLPWTLRRELDLSAGTPAYVSPEQASGDRELGPRSDVYSLACVVYEMLSGQTPFQGTSTEAIVSKRFFQAPPPIRDYAPETGAELESVVLRGMELEPERRPESAGGFAASLTQAGAGTSGIITRSSLALTRGLRAVRRATGFRPIERIGGLSMDGFWQDLVHAWRGLRRAPGFALVVILTLGIALGANATMFGLSDRLLFRAPAGIGHPEQLRRVLVARWITGLTRPAQSMSYPSFEDVRDRTRSFQQVAAIDEVIYSYGTGASARPVHVTLATGQYFPLLEVQPLLGRLFGEAEDRKPSGIPVAVLSHGFWRSAFGGDPGVLGRTIELGKKPYTVIGVAPEGFTGTELTPVDLWLPMSTSASGPFNDPEWLANRGSQWLQTLVRFKPGIAEGAAAEDATRGYREGHAESAGDFHKKAEASFAGLTGATMVGSEGNTARVAAWLLGVTVMLLVIACANIANLVLARGLLRRGEIAVRLALGVSRGRLLRQLLTESLLLAGLGFALGLVLVRFGSDLLRTVLLPGLAWEGSALNGRVLLVTGAATVLAAVVAGLLPLWRGTRTDVAAQLHGAARSTASHSKKLRTGLLLLQTGLSTALLIGAGLFLKSLTAIRGLDLGFTPADVAVVTVDLQSQGATGAEIKAFYREASERVGRIPGVRAAGLTIGSPFMGNWSEQVWLPGADSLLPELAGGGPYYFRAGAGALEALGVKLLRGRLLTAGDDRAEAEPVVIVSDRMARMLWPGRDALGQCLVRGEKRSCHTVVGVVSDLHRQALEERERPFLLYFTPLGQDVEYGIPQLLLVRVTGNPDRFTEPIRKELLAIRPDLPYVRVTQYQRTIDSRARSWRLGATMLTVFGALSLVIAAIGLYGVLSFAVTQRTQELGIRAALGASPARLMRLILGNGVVTAVVGTVLGVGLALALSSRITPLLFRTSALDGTVYVVTALTILGVAVLASWIPGLRATRVEPVRALKAE